MAPTQDLIPRFGIFKSIFNVCISFSGGRDRAGQNSSINPPAPENHQFDPRVKGSRLGSWPEGGCKDFTHSGQVPPVRLIFQP